MNYNKQSVKEGITLHKINTTKFKTNLFAIFITTPLSRANVTKNALISAVLRRGTENFKSQELISKELEDKIWYMKAVAVGENKSDWQHENGVIVSVTPFLLFARISYF